MPFGSKLITFVENQNFRELCATRSDDRLEIYYIYETMYIAIFCNRGISGDFEKSFFCCILDGFTLFFMSDPWPSPARGPKLAFFEILLSKLTEFR